ncbi:MAG: hypothetical protein EXR63_01275 [Dehalococcoidia bacterium]|nr:hypothetical protein [Dehalococcoidia bacterium]
MDDEQLLDEVEAHASMMTAVATGGPAIASVNDEYRARRDLIRSELRDRGVEDPNPHADLWAWYGYWARFPKWYQRRQYVFDMYEPIRELLREQPGRRRHQAAEQPTGWPLVDRQATALRSRLNGVRNEEDFQAVGLLARELMISLAQAVYRREEHGAGADGIWPSDTDAKRMIDAFIGTVLGGGGNEALRRSLRSVVDVAVAVQHDRSATITDAALCAELALASLNLLWIVSGQLEASRAQARGDSDDLPF